MRYVILVFKGFSNNLELLFEVMWFYYEFVGNFLVVVFGFEFIVVELLYVFGKFYIMLGGLNENGEGFVVLKLVVYF